jgi:hypothetical protein
MQATESLAKTTSPRAFGGRCGLAEQPPLVTTYYGCVNNTTGAIRIVSKSTAVSQLSTRFNGTKSDRGGLKDRRASKDLQGHKASKVLGDPRDLQEFPWATPQYSLWAPFTWVAPL